jgi:hypothetical protein
MGYWEWQWGFGTRRGYPDTNTCQSGLAAVEKGKKIALKTPRNRRIWMHRSLYSDYQT